MEEVAFGQRKRHQGWGDSSLAVCLTRWDRRRKDWGKKSRERRMEGCWGDPLSLIYRTNRWHIVFTLAFLNLQQLPIHLVDEMDGMVVATRQIVPPIYRSKRLYLHAVTNTEHIKDDHGALQPFVLHRGRFFFLSITYGRRWRGKTS